jgi:hypothetical protein
MTDQPDQPARNTRTARTIRALFSDARAELDADKGPADPPAHLARNGVLPGKWPGFPYDTMPPECPVQVHGYNGTTIYVTDAGGQLIELEKLDGVSLTKLFGRQQNYCEWSFPRFGKAQKNSEGEEYFPINGLEYQKMGRCFVAEAHRKGLFDPERQHRGRGGWTNAHGDFLWHSGEWLWISQNRRLQRARPNAVDGKLYTVAPNLLTPWAETVPAEESPAAKILEILTSWNWQRPYLDPFLVLGWIVTALMGGALPMRPIVFTTGGPGVGKTTLHNLIQAVLDTAVMHTSDTTSAGITQEKERDSTAVIVDEFEADATNRMKRKAVIDLARISAYGGRIFRGGADHKGVSFEARFSFFFSAILAPPMGTADKSRMAVINLDELPKGIDTGQMEKRTVGADDGRQMLRQIMDGWHDFRASILPDWQNTLRRQDFNERAIDTYATLLAAAQLVLGAAAMEKAGLPVDDQNALGEMISEATRSERASQRPPWQKCLEHLLSAPIQAYKGGERPTVGGTLDALEAGEPFKDFDNARDALRLAELALLDKLPRRQADKHGRKKFEQVQGYALAIPPAAQALEDIFRDTEWEQGRWVDQLKQAPSSVVLRGSSNDFRFKINRSTKVCVVIDFAAYDAWQDAEAADKHQE